MKKHATVRKFLLGAVVFLLAACLLATPFSAEQSISSSDLKHFNVMLVIDGSGSLVSKNQATDPNGLRYDAIDLFLALLTNSGNNVGSIVFDDDPENYLLNTGLLGMGGKPDKMSLSDQIRQAGTRANTNIGSALLEAVDTLSASGTNNGTQSVIILFSDGRTDLDGDEEAYQASLADKDAAITKAQEAHIPVYSICLNATPVADPAELQAISERTSGGFVSVSSAEDLSGAFEAFYKLIFSTSCEQSVSTNFDANGNMQFDFDIPSYGAEEVNIILDSRTSGNVSLQSPTSNYTEAQLAEDTMTGGNYQIIKTVDPEVGKWSLQLQGTPNSAVSINVIYNTDAQAALSTVDGNSDYNAGDTVTFQAVLEQDGSAIADSSITKDYKAQLTLSESLSGQSQTFDMVGNDDGTFTYDFSTEEYKTYQASASLVHDGMTLSTNSLDINFGNAAPAISDADKDMTQRVIVTPLTGRKRSYDLSKYFQDGQDSNLTYSIVNSQLVPDTVTLDGSSLTVKTATSRSGDLVLRATDSQGAHTDMTIHFKVTNLTLLLSLLLLGGILVAAVVLIPLLYVSTHPLFRGSISVSNVDSAMSPTNRSHASFRGKLKLSYFMVGMCGFDLNKSYFVTLHNNTLEFRSPTPFYINGMAFTKTTLMSGTTTLYADEARTCGIRIMVK